MADITLSELKAEVERMIAAGDIPFGNLGALSLWLIATRAEHSSALNQANSTQATAYHRTSIEAIDALLETLAAHSQHTSESLS